MRPSPSTPTQRSGRSAGDPQQAGGIAARAPTRIDFGGGWTDVPPYPERDGGFVCNVAISRYARVVVDIGNDDAPADALAAAALKRAGLRATARITSEFPVGAGLGGSSAAGVALQAAIAGLRGEPHDLARLVEHSRAVEVELLGVAGGWQDHYAAAFGGALALDFGGTTQVERIQLPVGCSEALAQRCLLLYTGETRISGTNITAVLDAYAARVPRVAQALARMAALARDMAAALRAGDLEALGGLVREHWEHQRALHPAIATDRIEAVVECAVAAGALGAKALGASGGGCVVVVAGNDPAPVRAAISGLGTLLEYTVDMDGVTVEAAA